MSRILGVIRELLWSRYLGAGVYSDAFFTAYKIPNSLRKIFAEGALSAAFIPTIVQTVRLHGREAVGKLMTMAFIIFEGTVLIAVGLIMYYADTVICAIAGGFTPEQIAIATPWLRILMPFIFFISSSALLAGALQAINHFFVAAFSPVLLNIVFIAGTLICLTHKLPITYLCWFMLAGGALQLLWHIVSYLQLGFSFSSVNRESFREFKSTLIKFILCLPATGAEELCLFISTSFASYLTSGSISLITYANRFAQLPQGVFGTAISTILLPHFSKVSAYAPKRLSFYLLESTKLIIWLMLPVTIFMSFFASDIFITVFLSNKFTLTQSYEAGLILQIYLTGLIFISLNKIMRILFYSQHNTWIPTLISLISVATNYCANTSLIHPFQAAGLALSTLLSTIVQTLLFIFFLKRTFKLSFHIGPFVQFLLRYTVQLCILLTPSYFLYRYLHDTITHLSTYYAHMLLNTALLWIWIAPLCILFAYTLLKTRRFFNITLHFID